MTKQAATPPPGDRTTPTAPPRPPAWRHWLWPVAIGLSLVLWLVLPNVRASTVPNDNLTYSQFLADVNAHQVKDVKIQTNGKASGALTNGHNYHTVIPVQLAGSSLLDRLETANVSISATTPGASFGSTVLSWLILLLPLLVLGWLWWRMSRGREVSWGECWVSASRRPRSSTPSSRASPLPTSPAMTGPRPRSPKWSTSCENHSATPGWEPPSRGAF